MSRPVTTRHRAEYAAFRLVRGVVRRLPEGPALAIGEALGWLAGTVFRIRRGVVDSNLALAFPERSMGWRARVARASYGHLGREAAALFRLADRSREWVLAATEVEGIDPLREAVLAGRGGIVVTGHLGSWEMGGAALAARGLPMDPVALLQANPLFDRDLSQTRSDLGLRLIQRRHASKEVLRSLRRGRVAGFVADQNARRGGVFVDFFGVPAATARGPALLARRSGAPLFVGACTRISRHPQRYRIVVQKIEVPTTDDLAADVRDLTAAWTRALECWVRRAPEQYFWQHKRWKTRPPDEASVPAPAGPGPPDAAPG